MNSNQVEGTAREAVGKLREGVGDVMGDDRMQGRRAVDHAVGAIQQGFGQVKEGAKAVVDGAPALDEIGASARRFGRQIDGALQDRLGANAPLYVLSGAIAFLGLALLWAGRERD